MRISSNAFIPEKPGVLSNKYSKGDLCILLFSDEFMLMKVDMQLTCSVRFDYMSGRDYDHLVATEVASKLISVNDIFLGKLLSFVICFDITKKRKNWQRFIEDKIILLFIGMTFIYCFLFNRNRGFGIVSNEL